MGTAAILGGWTVLVCLLAGKNVVSTFGLVAAIVWVVVLTIIHNLAED